MKIENLKQLQQLIKMCRQTGVDAIEVDNIKMSLGSVPYKAPKRASRTYSGILSGSTIAPGGITEDVRIETDELTEEQLLFYSARPEEHTEAQEQ